MGKDFSYIIYNRDEDLPDYDCWEWTNLNSGRNKWDGPYGASFTREEMIKSLENYLKLKPYDDLNFAFTLEGFGLIISEMSEQDLVYISYL